MARKQGATPLMRRAAAAAPKAHVGRPCPAFAPHRDVVAASRLRAVQSIPIIDPAGRLHRALSTHFRDRCRPSPIHMHLVGWYSEHVGAALAGLSLTA